MVAQHGGMDEAPPSVHVAHGKLDKCWRAGTKDLARDYEDVANRVCACTTSDCLRLTRLELDTLAETKYRGLTLDDFAANPKATEAVLRVKICVAKLTMPAGPALELFTSTTDAMCACQDFACTQAVTKQREAALSKYVDIDGDVDRDKLTMLNVRWCGCLEKAMTAELKAQSPAPNLTSVSVSTNCR